MSNIWWWNYLFYNFNNGINKNKNTGAVPRNKCSHKENSNGDIDHSNNSNVKYNAEKAHHKACYRRHNASFRSKKILNNSELHKFIDKSLLSFQSPEAIAGRLRSGKENLPYVSRTTIEHYINSPWGEHIRVEINKFKKKYDQLPDIYKKILELRYKNEKTGIEISKEIGVSYRTYSRFYSRIKKILGKEVK